MSSYYETVTGNLASSEIAKSEDIHAIQSNIQHAFANLIRDVTGDGYILDDDEDALKLTPIPDHVDQSNKNYDKDNDTLPFYDTYLRQKITTEKSEIRSIRVQMINESNLSPTVFAEIRDMDMNLKKETNTILPPTNKTTTSVNDPIDIDFIFNLQHLPIGDYYFIIRPVDISSADLTVDGDETIYDHIDASMFQIRYDIDGNYKEGLDASYNGVDYVPSNVLPSVYNTSGMIEGRENNCDLYFEQIYSAGNTYVINPAACMIMGQKIYPIDTHVTINGPSKIGDRTDLVYLDDGGLLHVLEGKPYTGDKIYPKETAGLKVAYITTYHNSYSTWTCPACGAVNRGNLTNCYVCTTSTNNRIPLIEQDDENGMTRQRDILERLRRLEKKLDYQVQNNIPSRIKYTCSADPTMVTDIVKVQDGTDSANNPMYRFVYAEDSYNLSSTQDSNGNTVLTFKDDIAREYSWSIVKKIVTTESSKTRTSATMVGTDIKMPTEKPSKVKNNQLYTLKISKKIVTTTDTTKEKSSGQTTSTSTKSYYTTTAGIKDLPVTFYIKYGESKSNIATKVITETDPDKISQLLNDPDSAQKLYQKELKKLVNKKKKAGKVIKTIKNKKTNSKGEIQLNLWDYKLEKGEYVIVAEYKNTKVTNKITIGDDEKLTSSKGKANVFILNETGPSKTSTNVKSDTFTGDDSFYKENIKVDEDIGEVSIEKTNPTKKEYQKSTNVPESGLKTTTRSFTIEPTSKSHQSTYGIMNFQVHDDCWIKSITPEILRFSNIKEMKIVLFKNDKVFDLKTSRTSYIKYVDTKKASTTNFPNVFESKWISLSKLDKTSEKKTAKVKKKEIEYKKYKLNKAYTFNTGEVHLTAGTYSLLVLGKLQNTKVEGKITVTEYETPDFGNYGAISEVKGTYNPVKVFLQKNSLTNTTWKLTTERYVEKFSSAQGTIISKTINTVDSIKQCAMEANFDIPPGCDIETYVSNNGGKTYIQMRNDTSRQKVKSNVVTFNGLGHEFKWKIILHSGDGVTPKLKYSEKTQSAIKFTLTTTQSYIGYEDYGRCFSTPLLNANKITTEATRNSNVKNKFAEWEFCRLWMEDDELDSTIDICFSYAYDNYSDNVKTAMEKWDTDIFFSQVLCNLDIGDFTQTSIDYDNYNADVEYDENNFRLKYDMETLNTKEIIVATPTSALSQGKYDYNYGDITDSNIDMSFFDYALMKTTTIYQDNHDDSTQALSGVHLVTGSYYQAMYDPQLSGTTTDICWSGDEDETLSGYTPEACIIGVSFGDGLEIQDQYTSLNIDIFPNLRDCQEVQGTTTGELEYDTTTGQPILKSDLQNNTGKYKDSDGYYYIPKNTLEIVVALNPYGLVEEDNATYGKVYPIDIPLRSCKHTQIDLNLSELYGATIYSIGIRVSTKKDNQGNYAVGWTTETVGTTQVNKNPSLHKGDILGLGNISLRGYNIRPYLPQIYSGDSSRWNWTSIKPTQYSDAYIIYQSRDLEGKNPYYSILPIIKDGNPKQSYYAMGIEYYNKHKTTFEYANYTETDAQFRREGSNRIEVIKSGTTDQVLRKSTDNANNILFTLNSQDGTGNLFKINTNMDTTPYDWVSIRYNLEILQSGVEAVAKNGKIISKNDNGYESGMEIMKGEVIFDLYDTTNISGATPVESLSLPAWGKVQDRYGKKEWNNGSQYVDKTVNAWFKLHTNATIKTIVLRRENPTNRRMVNTNIVLQDIVFINADSVPALGPQMHVRIYPKNMNSLINTKIRKFGCVYRLG